MITLKNGLVVMPQFMEAFEKLMKMEMPIAKCLQLSTTMEELDAQIKIVNRSRRVFLEKHCKKDDKGQFVVDDDGNATFDTPDIKSQCLKSID